MKTVEFIRDFEQIKLLTDRRRLAILRRLMLGAATLTQLGQALGEHPAWVRHHLKQLEEAGLVEMVATQVSGGVVEKYYQAQAQALIVQETILPAAEHQETVILLGSHDLGLNLLAQHLQENNLLQLLTFPVGSIDGLVALRQGIAHLTSCHLLDVESGEYNRPYVRHFFPDRTVALITLAQRVQGLMVRPGNPDKIRSLEDLARPKVVLANRKRGSGTRVWLDAQLNQLGIPTGKIRGYKGEAHTHSAVAQAIRRRQAVVGLGLEASARQAELDFIPLFQERYDLVLPEPYLDDPRIQPLLDYLHSGEFHQALEGLGGYDCTNTGDRITL
jgi:putative molybdopterin biosynthesis protein